MSASKTPKAKTTNPETSAGLTRRDFAAAAGGLAAVSSLLAKPAPLAAQTGSGPAPVVKVPLDLAEWSYFWVGVDRAELASGTYVNGKQMYVESWIPAQVKHPYPIVLVHGGGGQGLDWMGTPDGRPGWATYLAQEGYRVYVVDRPGHGRAPFHPLLHGAFPPTAGPLENISGRFTPPNPTANSKPLPFQHFHNQWVGEGTVGSKDLDQFVASQGGAYVQLPPPPGLAPGAPNPSQTAMNVIAHSVWRERGAMLLDKIGPAIIMTHSAGGPFGWLVAEARPKLVKGIIAIEGGGQPFTGANIWGMSTIPVAFHPPVNDVSELKLVDVASPEEGVAPYKLQAEPARKLKNLQGIPIVLVTSEGSFASPGNPGGVAYFKQAGCQAEELRLTKIGIHGNGHMMMVERNNRQVLQPILDWMSAKVEKGVKVEPAHATETSIKIADASYFWVGTERKKMPYGTILRGQMYVQYLIPQQVRSPYPIVLVHGGGGSMLHYMGVDGKAGWAHYYLQAGYPVYLVDRPGHGRAPYHPDALGPVGPHPSYATVTDDFMRGARTPNKQWLGTGDVGDPSLDQFQAGQNAAPADNVMAHGLWANRGAELLDRIGPAIIQVHSAGGPFGYLVANERPHLVKAIVNVEGAGAAFQGQNAWGVVDVAPVFDPPVSDPKELAVVEVSGASQKYKLQADGKVHKLKNLQGIPMVYVTAERSGRNGEGHAAFLKQAGCDAEDLPLKSRGILGNGHFMMIENNRKQVFDVLDGWIKEKVKA